MFGRPVHIIADEKIEMAVAIIIEPKSGRAEGRAAGEPAGFGDIAKCAFTCVQEQAILPDAGDQDVRESIVVVISASDSHAVKFDVESGGAGNVRESSVAIVFVELQGRASALVAGPVHGVYEQDVRVAIRVVIEKSAAGAECFWKEFAAIGAAVVAEIDSSLLGNVFQEKRWLRRAGGARGPTWQKRRSAGGSEHVQERAPVHGRFTRPFRIA